MNVKYESNNKVSKNPFEIELVKGNGEMHEYFRLNDDVKERITLSDLVDSQVEFIENDNDGKFSSGDSAQNASSGNFARNASSGDSAQNASSGDFARNASSGDHARNASSGYSAQNASSGDFAQNASSGNFARNASSGDSAQNASSGDFARNASSGDHARNASSGDHAQNASSGYSAQNASSGNSARNETTGKNSVTFDCGYKSTIKAINGTWISLCEYEKTNEDKYIPTFALAGQIGNSNYIDCNGKVLSEKETYLLYKKQFTPTIDLDGVMYKKINSRIKTDLEIIKCEDMDSGKQVFCVVYDNLSAHGYTLREAMEDLKFKQTESMEKSEIVAEIKKTGVVTRAQYRGITRACIPGMDSFASEHGYQNVEEVSLNELISKLDDKYWGAKEFKNLFKD